jgi:hypothetical protein
MLRFYKFGEKFGVSCSKHCLLLQKFDRNIVLFFAENCHKLQKIVIVTSTQATTPGVDVMITIFCDFCQFSSKNLEFFSKTNVIIKSLHNLALFRVKNVNFLPIFWRKYF